MTSATWASLWAGIDLAGTGVALVAMLVLHALPTGLSALHDPVSQYGITTYRLGYRVLTVALGVAGLACAAAIAVSGLPRGRAGTVGLLVVFGLSRLVISWVPMDPPGQPRSSRGAAHVALAVTAFLTVTVAADRMQRIAGSGHLAGVGGAYGVAMGAAFWLLVVGLAGLFLTGRASSRRRFSGACERLVYAGIYLLLAATGILLI